MKKMFAILMTLAMLCGCVSGMAEDNLMVGGWAVNQEEISVILPDDEVEIFDQADLDGYTLIATLATQVVAGVNYAFLARNDKGFAIIRVYRDLQGNVSVTHISPIDVTDIRTVSLDREIGDLVGGWAVRDNGKDPELSSEEAPYEYAFAVLDRDLRPVILLATQVVAGMNYKVLAQDRGGKALYVVTVYQPLSGDASILDIQPLDLLAYLAD